MKQNVWIVKRIKPSESYLFHAGKKGMKWGYNDGKKNGKRTAEEILNEVENGLSSIKEYAKDKLGYDERRVRDRAVSDSRRSLDKLNRSVGTSDYDAAKKEFDYDSSVALRAIDHYRKTPLGKIEYAKSVVDSGTYAVSKWLKKKLKIS